MKSITIKINLDNDDFQDLDGNIFHIKLGSLIERVGSNINNHGLAYYNDRPIMDRNGNTVGSVKVKL